MSFFLRWQRQQPTAVTLLSANSEQQQWMLTPQVDGFSLETTTSVVQFGAASLRFFAADWNVGQFAQVVDFLYQVEPILAEQPMLMAIYQPHPQLAPALRLELPVALDDTAVQQLRTLAVNWPGELVYLAAPVHLQQPGVLVMDMDSTAISIECIDEIAKLAGVGAEVAAVTARAMNGELDFAQSLRQRVATLAGAPQSVLQQVLDDLPLMPGLETLVSTLLQLHWQVAIASGGFTFFTEALKQRLLLSATFANQLEIVDGQLTGQVLGAVVDAARKAEVVGELSTKAQIPQCQTVAIGDGANDLPMLKTAALGVAFHAKPLVQAQAKAAIRQGSLLQLLYLLDGTATPV